MQKRSAYTTLKLQRDEMLLMSYIEILQDEREKGNELSYESRYAKAAAPFCISSDLAGRIIRRMISKKGFDIKNLNASECEELIQKLKRVTELNNSIHLASGLERLFVELGIRKSKPEIFRYVKKYLANA